MNNLTAEADSKIQVLLVLPPEYFDSKTIHCRDLKDNLLPTFERRFICEVCGYDTDYEKVLRGRSVDLILFTPPLEALNPVSTELPDFSKIPDTPIAGMLSGDKYTPLKLAIYRVLKKMGAVACFCTCEAPGEMLFIDDMLPFYHLNMALYINTSVFRDYNENKSIPLGFFGGGFDLENPSRHYPWRQKIFKNLYHRCPFFSAPRRNEISTIQSTHDIELAKYARLLNSCHISFTCGSHQNKILGKHLEIPACRCCMVAEDMPMLGEYGFVDMENCVTADENNILEKIDFLFSNRQELTRITEAGYQHVNRLIAPETQYNTIFEWFKLFKRLKSDEKVVQTGVFSLEIIKKHQRPGRKLEYGPDKLDQKWLAGYQEIQNNNFESAVKNFNAALEIVPYCPEAITGLGIILLFQSKAAQAEKYFVKNMQHVVNLGGIKDHHDPVDIAFIIICKLCQKQNDAALRLAWCWPDTLHPALNAARYLATDSPKYIINENNSPSRCPLIMSSEKWLSQFSAFLKMYGL